MLDCMKWDDKNFSKVKYGDGCWWCINESAWIFCRLWYLWGGRMLLSLRVKCSQWIAETSRCHLLFCVCCSEDGQSHESLRYWSCPGSNQSRSTCESTDGEETEVGVCTTSLLAWHPWWDGKWEMECIRNDETQSVDVRDFYCRVVASADSSLEIIW